MPPTALVDIVSAACMIVGAALVFVTAVAMFRANDALTRVNVLSPATGLGMPLVVLGAYVHTTAVEGFTWWGLVRLAITVTALLVVSSVASNTLSRAAYLSGAEVDPRTDPQDLAEGPEGRHAGSTS